MAVTAGSTPSKGFWPLGKVTTPMPITATPPRALKIALALVLVGVTALLRLYRLDELPGSLYYDEAQNGVDALRVIAGERPIFFPANNGREPLFIYLQLAAIALLGNTPFSLRIVAALAGCATVGLAYLVGRELHGGRAGYLAAFWLAISYWHVSLSRLGFRAVLLPLAELCCIYVLLRALRHGKRSMAWLAGLLLGLSFYTYGSARLFPLVLPFVILAVWKSHGRAWGVTGVRVRRVTLIVCVVAALTVLPLGLYFVAHPEYALGRAQQVTLGSSSDPRVWRDNLRPRTLPENALVTLGMLGFVGDENLRHNLPGRPVFDVPTFVLFVYGAISGLRCQTRWIGLLYLPWLLLLMVPGAIAVEAPHFLRTVGALPPTFLLLGVAGDRLLQRARATWWITAAIAVLLAHGTVDTYRSYFQAFAQHPERAIAFDAHVEAAARRAKAWREADVPVWVVARREYPQFRFLLATPELQIETVGSLAKALAAAHEQGRAAVLECFGCGQADVEPVILVAAHPPTPGLARGRSLLDETLAITGYETVLTSSPKGAGDESVAWIETRLHWRALDVIGTRYQARVLLIDGNGRLIAAGVDPMYSNVWPTTLWQPGERYVTLSWLAVSSALIAANQEFRLAMELTEAPRQGGTPTPVERIELGPVRLAE